MTLKDANMSMLEVAENLMLRKKTPQSFKKIAQEVSEVMSLSENELNKRLARFYADLTLSGKFVNVGGDKWDLKNRQKFEVAENQLLFEEDEVIDDEELIDEEEVEEEEDEDFDEDYEEEEEYEEEYEDKEEQLD